MHIQIPGWKVCQLRTECHETDKILRTKIEINVCTKTTPEIARDAQVQFFMIMFYNLIMFSKLSFSLTNFNFWLISVLGKILIRELRAPLVLTHCSKNMPDITKIPVIHARCAPIFLQLRTKVLKCAPKIFGAQYELSNLVQIL